MLGMVMPLIHEDRPKCHTCHEMFDDIESLREHQRTGHDDMYHEMGQKGPAPGDLAVF